MSLIGNPEVVVTVSTIKIPFDRAFASANGYDFDAILKVIELSEYIKAARSGFSKEETSIADHMVITLIKPATVQEARWFALRLKAIIEAIVSDDSSENVSPEGEDDHEPADR